MKRMLAFGMSLFVVVVADGILSNASSQQTLVTGTEAIIENQFYVVHSGAEQNDQLFNTANIYVIKGLADTVWVFGTGYGDKSPAGSQVSDFTFYRGEEFDASRNAIDDAIDVDQIITGEFGLNRQNVVLMLIVPHFHLDHINQEFPAAFFESLGYPDNGTAFLIHVFDFFGATCNEPCCGETPCGEGTSEFVAVPFHPSWEQRYLDMFVTIGDSNDVCNDVAFSFASPMGQWQAKKARFRNNGGHTNGSLNLDNDALQYRILGAFEPNPCPVANGWHLFPIHGNITVPTHIISEGSETPETFQLLQNFPNPFNPVTRIRFLVPSQSFVSIDLYDSRGRYIRALVGEPKSPGLHELILDGRNLASGVYFYRMQAGAFAQSRKMLLVK